MRRAEQSVQPPVALNKNNGATGKFLITSLAAASYLLGTHLAKLKHIFNTILDFLGCADEISIELRQLIPWRQRILHTAMEMRQDVPP